jgi:phosphoribosyl-ATP pyrophosphohydrolase/phosphoribosyl-ATP pyrophosphohydrolase/phosphoribosyl-AMP cyclohydrolase
MSDKTYLPEGEQPPASQIGASIEALAATIAARRGAGEESYTYRLLTGKLDDVLKKVMEESGEVALAAKDADAALKAYAATKSQARVPEALRESREDSYEAEVDHLRYEAADVVYHLLVVLARFGIGIDEFAAELNNRMRDDERPAGAIRLTDEHVQRGK